MLISIITPVYNTRKYLKRCFESVLKQRYEEFEFIIVDDGSTDGSDRVCDIYAEQDSRITVIHKKNEGQGKARNKAIENAMGEYLVFLDSDDFIDEGLLQYLSNIISKYNPEMIIYNHFAHNERNVKNYIYSPQTVVHEEILNKEKVWEKFLNQDNAVNGMIGNKCISRKFLLENNLLFPGIYAREDAFFLSELFKHVNNVILTNYIGYHQIIRYGSTEQQPFTADFFVSMDISRNNMMYIYNTFPYLYEAAYRRGIIAQINCLKGIAVDRKEKIYAAEKNRIKESLTEDLKVLKRMNICGNMYDEIMNVIEETGEWKKECFLSAIKKYVNRIERFLYGKFL